MNQSKRIFDLICTSMLIFVSAPLFLIIAIVIKATSRGRLLHWSNRVGKDNEHFRMPKFRTMREDTPQLPTHLLSNPAEYLTPAGRFLRRSSLDELPQFFSIMAGDLSLVGPRPALFNQKDLVELRTARGIHQLVPGLTGWAQVNGRDEIPLELKVRLDYEYMQKRSFAFDIKVLFMTVIKVVTREGVMR